MKRIIKRTPIILITMVLMVGALGVTLIARTQKANAEVAAGNLAFSAQDYETALQHYAKAQSQAPGQAEPLYNAANVFYMQQTLDKAQQSLDQALAQPQKAIEESIYFNLGNVAFKTKQFEAAVTQYESALRIDPSDKEAKYNLELALQQKQNQQDQQQQQNKQNQEQNQQGQQDQQNQQGQQDQQQNQQGQQDQQQNQQDQQGQQNQQDQQSQQNQQSQQGNSSQTRDQQDQPNGQVTGAEPQQGLTQEQARQLLAAIAGKSKTLMQQLQMYYYIPGYTSDKDW